MRHRHHRHPRPFHNRREAGQNLAARLNDLRGRRDLIVLGLPRGGIPVAYEIAVSLHAPLDAFIVRKLGVPGHEELAMGAIASGDIRVMNDALIHEEGIPQAAIEAIAAKEQREMQRREQLYRDAKAPPPVHDRTVILVDDGLATGSTMLAAVLAVRQLGPAAIVVAVPVGAPGVCQEMGKVADRVECAVMPEHFQALGLWYEEFTPTPDNEVRALLADAAARPGLSSGSEPLPVSGGAPSTVVDGIAAASQPRPGTGDQFAHLLDAIGDARLVLIGEATHGSTEFYRDRATITRRLIEEKNFHAVAVEADWPDAFRVNRFVRGASDDTSPNDALGDFRRFPQWMWRNVVVEDFVGWLRDHNARQPLGRTRVGFYGLDLYSLGASMQAVIQYLDTVDPEAADRARVRYGCFEDFGGDAQHYGYAASIGTAEPCEDEVVQQLLEMQRRAGDLAIKDGQMADDAFFSAEQNARLARNAERYYRSMFHGRVSSWNLRDTHMAETLDALIAHLEGRTGQAAKIVVWAHNSHLGDARATQMGDAGELNLGQLTRERHPGETFLLGQTTYDGTVSAADDWDEPVRCKRIVPGLPGSYEALFHDVGHEAFLLDLRNADPRLREFRLQRAIGVIYRPETERVSHYFDARIGAQFDAILHHDRTTALHPLERTPLWDRTGEAPESYPFAAEPLPGNRRA